MGLSLVIFLSIYLPLQVVNDFFQTLLIAAVVLFLYFYLAELLLQKMSFERNTFSLLPQRGYLIMIFELAIFELLDYTKLLVKF